MLRPAAEVTTDGSRSLSLDQGDEITYIAQLIDLSGRKFDPEGLLDGDDQVDMGEGVPLLDVIGGQAVGKHQRWILKQVLEKLGKLGAQLRVIHVK